MSANLFLRGSLGFLFGTLLMWAFLLLMELRRIGWKKFACEHFGHTKPVYHISRAFWWCERCGITLGMNPDLWTPEAMLEHSDAMRRPDRN